METALSAEQKQFYADNGYILIKGLLTKTEAAEYRRETHDIADRLMKIRDINATWASVREGEANAAKPQSLLLHCHDVQYQSSAFSRLLVNPKLIGAMTSLIGPNVQLHHTKMFIKPPERGAPFPMHQDYPYFPHDRHTMSAVIIHFDDAPIAKGCVRVVPGSHKLGPIKETLGSDNHLDPEKYPVEKAMPCEAEAGDALFFNYLTIHGSGINSSNEARTTLLIQFRDPIDPPTFVRHESRGQGFMLAGIDPSCATTKVKAQ